jgi:hypothetical protein
MHGRTPLTVAVLCQRRDSRSAVSQVQQALASQAATSTIPVIGSLAEDSRSVDGLRAGELTKRLLGSDLLKSAKTLADTLTGWFPELIGMPAPPVVPAARHGYEQPPYPAGPPAPGEPYHARWGTAASLDAGGAA